MLIDPQTATLLLPARPAYTDVLATREVDPVNDFGKTLLVDPAGGTVQIQLPATAPFGLVGWFCRIRQVTAGTVEIAATGAATLVAPPSFTGPTYTIAELWGEAVVEFDSADHWIVQGNMV